MLEKLPEERWEELTDIFQQEFGASLPHRGKSDILADVDENGEIHGFVVLQFVGLIGQIWNSGKRSRAMLNFFNNEIPPGNTVITIADEPRLQRLSESYGMRRLTGAVFRKDF